MTGRKVIRAAAEHLTPLTLELGGKSPAIIDGTMKPDVVAGRICWGKALNAGQVCIAPDYLSSSLRWWTPTVKAIVSTWSGWFGDDVSASDSYGRVVNAAQFDRLVATLDDALAQGATVVHGGRHDRDLVQGGANGLDRSDPGDAGDARGGVWSPVAGVDLV